MPTYTEATRQRLIDLIHSHTQTLDRLGGQIAKAHLKDLPELVAEAETSVTNALTQLRTQTSE